MILLTGVLLWGEPTRWRWRERARSLISAQALIAMRPAYLRERCLSVSREVALVPERCEERSFQYKP